MVYLASVLRELKAGRPLPIQCPVIVTRTGFSPRELVRCLVFSLEAAASKVRIHDDGHLEEQRKVVAGRHEDVDLVVQDKLVSKRHCVLEKKRDGWWWVDDLSSANGTFIGEDPVEPGKPARLPRPLGTISLGPSSKLTYMEEAAFKPFLEQALEAWRQAFGRGNTGQIRKAGETVTGGGITKSGRVTLPEFDGAPTRVEGPEDASTDSPPQGTGVPFRGTDTDTTKRVPVDKLRELLMNPRPPGKSGVIVPPVAPGLPPDVEETVRKLSAQKAEFEFILDGARVESPETLEEALELVREEPKGILCIDARLPSGERILVFQRERKG
jgi:pSer/pThr/pTyr-binding forkhead associated (FHA) protein